MDNSKTILRTAPAHYRELTERIVKLSGMKHSIYVYQTENTKAWLTHSANGIPILAYNPNFIARAEAAVKWTSAALFASEIVYHRNKDLYGKYICDFYDLNIAEAPRKKRLNVDHFIGRVLRHEGASLEEALEAISFIGRYKSFEERELRKDFMIKGWNAADIKIKSETLALPSPKANASGTALAGLLFGLLIYLFKE